MKQGIIKLLFLILGLFLSVVFATIKLNQKKADSELNTKFMPGFNLLRAVALENGIYVNDIYLILLNFYNWYDKHQYRPIPFQIVNTNLSRKFTYSQLKAVIKSFQLRGILIYKIIQHKKPVKVCGSGYFLTDVYHAMFDDFFKYVKRHKIIFTGFQYWEIEGVKNG